MNKLILTVLVALSVHGGPVQAKLSSNQARPNSEATAVMMCAQQATIVAMTEFYRHDGLPETGALQVARARSDIAGLSPKDTALLVRIVYKSGSKITPLQKYTITFTACIDNGRSKP